MMQLTMNKRNWSGELITVEVDMAEHDECRTDMEMARECRTCQKATWEQYGYGYVFSIVLFPWKTQEDSAILESPGYYVLSGVGWKEPLMTCYEANNLQQAVKSAVVWICNNV